MLLNNARRYGTASFCRTGAYGMPQFVTNTMRVCTRDAPGAAYDASVPVKPVYNNTLFDSSEELCSESPFDVPWSLEDAKAAENPAALFSVGNVPMWDGSPVDSANPIVYPANTYAAQLDNTDPGTWLVCCEYSIMCVLLIKHC